MAKQNELRNKVQITCSANKVRYYTCQLDNTQTVKYINYEYDQNLNKCVEKV